MGLIAVTIYFLIPYGIEQIFYFILTKSIKTRDKNILRKYGITEYFLDFSHFIVFVIGCYQVYIAQGILVALYVVGLGMYIFGIAIRVLSLRSLGEFYDPAVALYGDHKVVKTRVYKYLRHPLHVGTLLQVFGLALFAPWWVAIPIISISWGVLIYKNLEEDKILLANLGNGYKDYYLQSWDFVDLLGKKFQGD